MDLLVETVEETVVEDGLPVDEQVEPNDEVFAGHREDDLGFRLDVVDEEQDIADCCNVKWTELTNVNEAIATVGVATDTAWDFAQKEFQFIRQKLEEKTGTQRPKIKAIIDVVLGEESTMHEAFKDEGIFEELDDFHRFLATFFMTCAYQVSTKQLFDKDSRISLEGAMAKSEYVRAWHMIGNASTPPQHLRDKNITPTGMVPFWMKVEAAFNEHARELFIVGYDGTLQVTIDDDKAHFNGKKYKAGLKTVRHTKDNRDGHTCHTLVHSYSQTPVQIAWERQVNDSSETATRRCFNNGITPMAATGSQAGDLRHVRTGKDRGYWTKDLLHDFFMQSGAKITAGTVKRQACIPYTFSQKLKPNDNRIDIPTVGPKTLYIAKCTSHGRDLFCHAYKNGTGGVTLGLSTEFGGAPEWELVPANPVDLKWYDSEDALSDEEAIRKCFGAVETSGDQQAKAGLTDDFVAKLVHLPVSPLTTTQGTPEWFILRKYALTSSTVDKCIACCTGNEDWLENHDAWATIKGALSGVVSDSTVPNDEDDDGPEPPILQAPPTGSAADEDMEEAEEEIAAATEDTSNEAPFTVESLLSDGAALQLAKNQARDDEVDINIVRGILVELGHNLSNAQTDASKLKADKKTFKDWLEVSTQLKPFWFKKKADLATIATALGLDADALKTRDKARKAINDYLLANPDATLPEVALPQQKTATRRKEGQDLDGPKTLLYSVLRAGYLSPLASGAKKYTRRGHELECHIIRSCVREHAEVETKTPLRVEAACSAPLVERTSARYARDSIDFVAEVADEDFCIGVEVKARVGNIKDQNESRHVESIRRILGADRTPRQRKVKYFEVDADSHQFAGLVRDKHEAVQVMHHAFVYDFDRVLLLVGDNTGEVMYGIFVNVSADVRKAYGDVLEDIYRSTMQWMYNRDAARPSDEYLASVVTEIKFNKAPVDLRSFKMDMALWQDIDKNVRFPLLRLARIIPLVFAYWNSIKGGSDATTNLLWHCQYSIPSNENQSSVIARMLSLCSIHVHRMEQVASAKGDISKCGSLRRFRDAASSRRPYKKTMNMIIDELTAKPNEVEASPPSTPTNTDIDVRATRGNAHIQHVRVPIIQTNATPQRNVSQWHRRMEKKLADEGKIDAKSMAVLKRTELCTGTPVFRIGADGTKNGKGSRGTCAYCKGPTHVYCMKCKRWLCGTLSKHAMKLAGFKSHYIINPDSDSPIHAEANCFYLNHRREQEKEMIRFVNETLPSI